MKTEYLSGDRGVPSYTSVSPHIAFIKPLTIHSTMDTVVRHISHNPTHGFAETNMDRRED